jgi:hypothetical protein
MKRLPNVNFFVQQISLPSVQFADIAQPAMFNPINIAGDRLSYSDLSVTFKVDEDLTNYIEIYDWMVGLGKPHNFEEYKKLKNSDYGLYSDADVIIKSSQKNPSIKFTFTNLFPISLTSINLDTTAEDIIYVDVTAEFKFDTFSITRLRND